MKQIYKRNIGLEWYHYGLEKGDDFFIKFMMHWVAFNWLYDSFPGDCEWKRIRAFCNDNINKLSKYDAFDTKEYELFSKRPIMDGHGSIRAIQQKRYDEMVKVRSLPHLIETLYQVRCNLFHGSKSIYNERDIEVVKASAVILEGFLKAYFEVEKNEAAI